MDLCMRLFLRFSASSKIDCIPACGDEGEEKSFDLNFDLDCFRLREEYEEPVEVERRGDCCSASVSVSVGSASISSCPLRSAVQVAEMGAGPGEDTEFRDDLDSELLRRVGEIGGAARDFDLVLLRELSAVPGLLILAFDGSSGSFSAGGA